MKIAYLCNWEISTNDGVTKKIHDQIKSWKKLGHEVNVYCSCKIIQKSILDAHCYVKPTLKTFFRLIGGPKDLLKNIDEFGPDFIYLRHELYKPYLLDILRKYKIVVEINADDVIELKLLSKTNVKGFLRYIYHRLTRSILFNNANVLVSVTKELSEREVFKKYKKPIIISPNSIMLNNNLKNNSKKEKTNFVFIGSLTQPWQGLDKVERLAEIVGENYIFHIIGDSGEKKDYNNVRFYGYLQRDEYEKVIKGCNIGIGTLAAHRKGLDEACALKVREYIAYGLPVIIAYKDTAFLEETPEWILEITNTEDNVEGLTNINKIIEFTIKMKDYIVQKEESSKFIDAYEIEKRKITEICKNLYESYS